MVKNKKVFILGMARSGYEAAKLLAKDNDVLVTDIKEQDDNLVKELESLNVKVVIKDDPIDLLDDTYDLMIKNPGIKYDHKTVVKAKEMGIPVINELELAYGYLDKGVNIIGVTGSNGKTTTVTLIYKMLLKDGKETMLGGNIGTPLCNFVKDIKKDTILVLEISDHQLCDMYDFKTNVSVLTNIYEAHTDFHDSHEKYRLTKKKIFNNHTNKDIAIINFDNEEAMEITNDIKSTKYYFSKDHKQKAYIKNKAIYYDNDKIIDLDRIKIKGSHNYENIMAAICAVKEYGCKNSSIVSVLEEFNGVEHRIEYVDTIKGVKYYNDSKATNCESTKTALNSFEDPTLLILGGLDRKHSFEDLNQSISHVKYIACYGETKNRIKEYADNKNIPCEVFENLKEATNSCHKKAKKGDVVLLSPACASWDQYKTFEERGEEFKNIVSTFKDIDIKKYKNIYMIGIGGISMSGIAEILKDWKYNVSGSDIKESDVTRKLIKNGIKVNIGQVKENITEDIDLVVYTAAIKNDNEELKEARRLNIPCVDRGRFLGEITKLFKDTIGVSGTHGKTTTTSMLSSIFLEAKKDPTIQVGTILNLINGNYRIGHSDYLIIEACEYSDSYLNFHQKSAIVLNIDNDHLDYFKNIDNIQKSFENYVSLLPKDGFLVINNDDKRCRELKNHTLAKVITVGKNSTADYYYKNVRFNSEGYPTYDVFKKDKKIGTIELSITGLHNVFNSLCAVALADAYKINFNFIKNGLKKYTGASRRLEYKGDFMGTRVYDDYGHHPTEILATIKGLKHKSYNESWVIFEPHTYSRLKEHLKDFAKVLTKYDHIIVIDIYAARETNTYNISVDDLINEIASLGKKAHYISDYNEIKKFLSQNVKSNDIIITQGAGLVTKVADILIKK